MIDQAIDVRYLRREGETGGTLLYTHQVDVMSLLRKETLRFKHQDRGYFLEGAKLVGWRNIRGVHVFTIQFARVREWRLDDGRGQRPKGVSHQRERLSIP